MACLVPLNNMKIASSFAASCCFMLDLKPACTRLVTPRHQVDVFIFLSDGQGRILQNLHHSRQEFQHDVAVATRKATVQNLHFLVKIGQREKRWQKGWKRLSSVTISVDSMNSKGLKSTCGEAKSLTFSHFAGVPLVIFATHVLK